MTTEAKRTVRTRHPGAGEFDDVGTQVAALLTQLFAFVLAPGGHRQKNVRHGLHAVIYRTGGVRIGRRKAFGERVIDRQFETACNEHHRFVTFRGRRVVVKARRLLSGARELVRQLFQPSHLRTRGCRREQTTNGHRRFHVVTCLLIVSILPSFATSVHADLRLQNTLNETLPSRWQRYSTDKVDLDSNVAPTTAKRFLKVLHRFEAAVDAAQLLPANAHGTSRKPKLLVFKSYKEFQRVVDQPHIAGLATSRLDQVVLLIGPDANGEGLQDNLLHEYSHYLLRTRTFGWPLWLEEGLATLFGQTALTTRSKTVTFGRFPLTRGLRVKREDYDYALNARKADIAAARKLRRFYRASAHLTHYLLFGQQLAGSAEAARVMDHDIFRLSEDERWEALRRYAKAQPHTTSVAVPLAEDLDIEVQPMSDRDRSAAIAAASEFVNASNARRLYKRLYKQEPHELNWLVGVARTYVEDNEERARDLVATALEEDADHVEALLLRARLLTRTCRPNANDACFANWRTAAGIIRQALHQDAQHIEAAFQLGLTELYSGQPEKAVGYLRLAYRTAPWSAQVNLHFGECLRLLGRPHALTHLRQAQDWATLEFHRVLATKAIELSLADLSADTSSAGRSP